MKQKNKGSGFLDMSLDASLLKNMLADNGVITADDELCRGAHNFQFGLIL